MKNKARIAGVFYLITFVAGSAAQVSLLAALFSSVGIANGVLLAFHRAPTTINPLVFLDSIASSSATSSSGLLSCLEFSVC